MHLLYCTFGNHFNHHLQAGFSAMSFLQQRNQIDSINIITDAPAFYKHLSGHVNVITVTPEKIKEWHGPYNYFFRVKIKAIQEIAAIYPGEPVMYCDTDTFLYSDISSLKADLLRGKAYMHEDEGLLSQRPGKSSIRVWQAVKGKTLAGIETKADDHMRNAGIVATPNTQGGKDLELALKVCDEICANSGVLYLAEQYSFSLTLNHIYTAGDASPWIAHYWSNKPDWNQFILSWVAEQQFKGQNMEEMLAAFSRLDLSQVPVYVRRKSTAEKLNRLVDRIFPSRDHQYIKRKK
jgi:hypothetical protein